MVGEFSVLSLLLDTQAERLDPRLNAVAQVRQALSALRGIEDVTAMLRKASIEVCVTCGFDRAIISRVHRSHIVVEAPMSRATRNSVLVCWSPARPAFRTWTAC